MAIIKCKMCGGDVELAPDKTFGTCDYCGSTMTFPKVDDEQRAAAFNRGNHFRRIGEFDKALAVYERIVAEDDTDAEAHWCCALCRFGIEYVEDPATYEYIPTCHRASFDSILEDVDYLAAVEHSDGITRRQYQKDAAKIAEVQRGILATSQHEEPFDVFICYKETDDTTHERTRDSLDAQEIYYQLTEKGYRVFFARITLEDKAGSEYEPYIFAALQSAKVMIALGSKPEHFNAVWVKNEWSRFLALMKKDRSKLLLPCYRGMDPYDLPEQLSVLQSYDMGKIGFMQDLIRGVEKVLRRDEPKPTAQPVVQTTGGPNVAAQIKRGQQALEDRDWTAAEGFFDKALDMDAECAEAFFGKALAAARCENGQALTNRRKAVRPEQKTEQTACERDEARIRAAVERHADIPDYYEAKSARACFTYDERTYDSLTEGWQQRIEQEKQYWEQDRNLSRAVRYAKGPFAEELKKRRDEIESRLRSGLEASRKADESETARVTELYRAKLDEADRAAEDAYQSALRRRQTDYENLLRRGKNTAASIRLKQIALELDRPAFRDIPGQAEQLQKFKKAAAERAEAEAAEEMRREKARKAKKRRTGIIAACIAAFAVAMALLVTKVIIPNSKYNTAVKLYESGEYDEAIAAFEAMDGYKDSAEKINECKLGKAVALLEAGEYEAAYELLESVGNSEMIQQSKYDCAMTLIDSGDYQSAFFLLNGLNYKDSDEQLSRIRPQLLSTAEVGSAILFGSYEQDNNTDNGKEEIEWLVLAREGDRMLVISRYALDCQPYNASHTSVTWETCSVRAWLNGTFVSAAFSSDELNMIQSVRMDHTYTSASEKDTADKVFLLNVSDAKRYLSLSSDRQCQGTAYCYAQGTREEKNGNCWWWLRGISSDKTNYIQYVTSDGAIIDRGHIDSFDDVAVRPAMWISITP